VRPTLPSAFVPPGNRARLAIILLAATIAVDVVAIESDFLEISAVNRFLDGKDLTTAALASSDHRQTIVGLLQLAVLAVTAIVFIRWFHAVYRNIASLGATELRFKPGWAIGAWFVPLLAFWRPKQIANDIWRASEPEPPASEAQAPRTGKTGLLTLWWSFWILSTVIDHSATRIFFNANTLTDFSRGAKLDIAALVLDITAAVLAILVVHRITKWQLSSARPTSAGLVLSPAE
jgi:hypothetical protein